MNRYIYIHITNVGVVSQLSFSIGKNRPSSQDPGKAIGMRLNFNNDQNHYRALTAQKMHWRLPRSVLLKKNKTNKKQRNQNLARKDTFTSLYFSVNLLGEAFLVISSNPFEVPWPRTRSSFYRFFPSMSVAPNLAHRRKAQPLQERVLIKFPVMDAYSLF